MLDYTSWTLGDFLGQLKPLGLQRECRPAEFEGQKIALGTKTFSLDSAGWLVAGGRMSARYARIQGQAMDIATVMVYPTASPEIIPVFAAEWVVFGDRVHALILDVEICGDHPALLARMEQAFDSLGKTWQTQFPENRERPEWFCEIAMPWALYGSCGVNQLEQLRKAFNDYLDRTISLFYLPASDQACPGPDAPSVASYKHHHYVNSPGHRLLGVKFGQKKTDQLLKDFHFGPARIDGWESRVNEYQAMDIAPGDLGYRING